jgi:hypothetical protein
MGSDFIEKAAPTFKKAWDRARVRLATADLFTQEPSCAARTVAADLVEGFNLTVGECLIVEHTDQGILVRRDFTTVARIDNAPEAVGLAIRRSCGIAKATVEQVHQISGVVELSLC